MKKIISVLLVAVLLCTAFVACKKSNEEVISAKVTVTIVAEDTKIIENIEVTIDGIDGEAPLAIDAIIAALDDQEIDYELTKLGNTDKLEKIGDYDTENNKYIWELYLNGEEEPAAGRLATVEIEEGDTLLVQRNAYESVVTSEETAE